MDIFMDKLAQKSTAQEIIKANTAADLEELSKLRNQVAGYSECLTKLQTLLDEGAQKLAGARMNGEELKGLMKQNAEDTGKLQLLMEEFRGQLEGIEQTVGGQLDLLSGVLETKVNDLTAQIKEAESDQLFERLDTVEENVHKECVKVYRNVQAVMVEESGKQAEALKEAAADTKKSKGRMGFVMAFSVLAMLFSLTGVILQILNMTHIIG